MQSETIKELDVSEEKPKDKRQLSGRAKQVVAGLAIVFALFHLITVFFPVDTISQRSIHLTFALVLVFIIYPFNSKTQDKIYIFDYLLIGLSILVGLYMFVESEELMGDRLGVYTTEDVAIAIILVVLVLEATRRLFGNILMGISIIALLYAYFGNYIPGMVGHKGYSIYRISTTMGLWTEGIFGTPLGISATFVAVFVIFGSFLNQSGIGEFFIRIAYAFFGQTRGGPAKAAIVGSGLMGTVSGSAVANVVTTGTFTIPLMKKVGFSPEFAGAVEAVASSGGQLVPPVMGATAFIMAEMVGLPYANIVVAAIIPAWLYYACLYFTVDAEAGKMGFKGESKENLEDWKVLLKQNWFLFLPLIILVYTLVFMNVSTGQAAFWAICSTVIITLYAKRKNFSFKLIVHSLESGGYGMLEIAIVTAMAGLITGVLSLTGLGLKVSGLLVGLAGGNTLLLLVLSMIVSIIAGMGLPIVACYLLLAVLVAPALVSMGVSVLGAHLFIFIFGIFSAITPPVAIAAYVAAGIARGNPMKTGWIATKIALPLFLVPYTFAYNPALIAQGAPIDIGISVVTATIGIFFFASGLVGYLKYYSLNQLSRIVAACAGVLCIWPGMITDLVGIALGGALWLYLWSRNKTKTTQAGV